MPVSTTVLSLPRIRVGIASIVGGFIVGSYLCSGVLQVALCLSAYAIFSVGLERMETSFRHVPSAHWSGVGLDVVVPVHRVTCMVTVFIEHVNTYIRPARILIATKQTQCAAVENISANVKCLDEDHVVPGVTKASIQMTVSKLLSNKVDSSEHGWGGHSIAGWYLQQFIKLGVGASPLLDSNPLSEVYLVLDSDAIPVADVAMRDGQGRMPLMAGGDPRYWYPVLLARWFKPKNLVTCDYYSTYYSLTGMGLSNSPDGKGYVPHHMVMRKTYVREMLAEFAKGADTWYNNVLNIACRDIGNCECGFSEYASMASWVKRYHPDAVYDVPASFIRYHDRKHCCADDAFFRTLRTKRKYKLIMFERGVC